MTQTFLGVLSDFQHHPSGTRCHKQFSSATLTVFKSRLKFFYSLTLSRNTDPTCRQRHTVTTVWRYRYSIIMRPSSLGGGRILRRTLSVCLSVRLSVRPSRYGHYRASRRAT